MKKILIPTSMVLLFVIIVACGGISPQSATAPAAPTQAVSQPTQIPPANTAVPVPSNTAAPTETQAATATVSYSNDVMPIFNQYCVKCHGLEQIKEGLDLRTYDTLLAGSFNGPVVIPGDAANSYLIQLLNEGKMPKRGPKPTTDQVQIITDWINQGAANN
jgi:mono/diheme cytochrome c family protein